MQEWAYFLVPTAFAMLILQGAQHADQKPAEAPAVDVRGIVKKLDSMPKKVRASVIAVLTVEGPAKTNAFYARASVTIMKDTKIVVAEGKQRKAGALTDLKEGQLVEVVFRGLVVNSADPPEGTAGTIVILPDAKK